MRLRMAGCAALVPEQAPGALVPSRRVVRDAGKLDPSPAARLEVPGVLQGAAARAADGGAVTRRPYVAHPRHPVTGRQFRVSARSARQLARLLGLVDTMREELRLGTRSSLDVGRQLRRLTHGPVTLERATESYACRGDLADVTRSRVRSWIEGPARELRARELDDLDAPTVAAWVARVARSSAPSTTGLAWRTLRAVVRYAAERGLVDRCPWGSWRPSTRIGAGLAGGNARALREACRTAEERNRLIAAAVDVAPELGCKVGVAAYLGLRSSELARLAWSDLDPAGVFVDVRGSKGTPPARLPLPPLVWELLERQAVRLEAAGLLAPRGPVFRAAGPRGRITPASPAGCSRAPSSGRPSCAPSSHTPSSGARTACGTASRPSSTPPWAATSRRSWLARGTPQWPPWRATCALATGTPCPLCRRRHREIVPPPGRFCMDRILAFSRHRILCWGMKRGPGRPPKADRLAVVSRRGTAVSSMGTRRRRSSATATSRSGAPGAVPLGRPSFAHWCATGPGFPTTGRPSRSASTTTRKHRAPPRNDPKKG